MRKPHVAGHDKEIILSLAQHIAQMSPATAGHLRLPGRLLQM